MFPGKKRLRKKAAHVVRFFMQHGLPQYMAPYGWMREITANLEKNCSLVDEQMLPPVEIENKKLINKLGCYSVQLET